MLSSDHLGVTSILRDLSLHSRCYESLIHFFRSFAWSLESLRLKWLQIVKQTAPLSYVNGMAVLIGEGMKQTKEARRMPGVKKLHQESENSSKAEYIFGHLFGAIGILMGTPYSCWIVIFLSVPALERLNELNAPGKVRMHIVTKAKSNAVAYEQPPLTKQGRGRPRKK